MSDLYQIKEQDASHTVGHDGSNCCAFVEATVNYRANVTFTATASAGVKHVCLLGTKDQIRANLSGAWAAQPWAKTDIVATLVESAGDSKITSSLVPTSEGLIRLMLAVNTTTTSRHNCPHRPDVMTTLVRAAVGETKGEKGAKLQIFSGCDDKIVVTAGVSRGACVPFNAKAGKAEKKYLDDAPAVEVVFASLAESAAKKLQDIATCTQICMRLVEAPTNLVDTVTFTQIATAFGKKYGFKANIIAGDALREGGYGGIYGVGKAAEFPPHLVTLHYEPQGGMTAKEKIALVGKGIVYDTGGLAIKTPYTNMCGMKRDMGGAAAVFTGFLALVMLGVPHRLSCTLCLADNAIGPNALRNDDIIRMKSGVTVEVTNTDAEGRLVLGDGVYHASAEMDFTPDVIIDMATLTGATQVGSGRKHASLYTDSDDWEARFVAAAKSTGDLIIPIVHSPEYHVAEFASKVADHKNLMNNTANAGMSCAGAFIMLNLAKSFKGSYCHFDIAGTAYDAEGATGYGVPLLVRAFGGYDI